MLLIAVSGEVVLKFKAIDTQYLQDGKLTFLKRDFMKEYNIGDRIGQIVIMPVPQIEFNVVDELSTSDRGVGGFGSTDPVTSAIESNCE